MAFMEKLWSFINNDWTTENSHSMVRKKYESFGQHRRGCTNADSAIVMVDKMQVLLSQTEFNNFMYQLQSTNAHGFDVCVGISKIPTYKEIKEDNFLHTAFASAPCLKVLFKDDPDFIIEMDNIRMENRTRENVFYQKLRKIPKNI